MINRITNLRELWRESDYIYPALVQPLSTMLVSNVITYIVQLDTEAHGLSRSENMN